MKKITISFLMALVLSFSVFSQSAELMSELLNTEKVTCLQASYLPAVYVSLVGEDASQEEAYAALLDNGYFKNLDSQKVMTLSELSFVYTKALGISGGLFYTLFKSPRYAFKELKARGILPPEADPDSFVSGHDVVDLFNNCLEIAPAKETIQKASYEEEVPEADSPSNTSEEDGPVETLGEEA